jgi:hypothetical protein
MRLAAQSGAPAPAGRAPNRPLLGGELMVRCGWEFSVFPPCGRWFGLPGARPPRGARSFFHAAACFVTRAWGLPRGLCTAAVGLVADWHCKKTCCDAQAGMLQ